MISILSVASALQRALDEALAEWSDKDSHDGQRPARLAALLWPIMLCQLGIAPLRLPRDCVSVSLTTAAPVLLSLPSVTFDAVRAALQKPGEGHVEARKLLENASNALGLLGRAVSRHSPFHTTAMSALSAFFMLLSFVLREDWSQKSAASSVTAALRSLAPSPGTHALLALSLLLSGDLSGAAAEAETAVSTALKAAPAAVAFAFYARGEVRRGVLAQGNGSSRSFEWAEDLRRADKENPCPTVLRLSSVSLQAATSASITPARQTQAAVSLLAVFQAVGFKAIEPPPAAPQEGTAGLFQSDSDWASHLDSMALLLTYFPCASELVAAFGVSLSAEDDAEVHGLSSSLSQLLRDDRMQRLALFASRLSDETCPSRQPFPASRPSRDADAQTRRPPHTDVSPRNESTRISKSSCHPLSSATVPKMIRRVSAATEAEMLRTQQQKSFWYSRPSSAASARPYSRSFSVSRSVVE